MEPSGHLPERQEKRSNHYWGHEQSERRRRARKTGVLTDRLVEGTSVGSGVRLKSWLCHLLTERLWESLYMSLCLSFPIDKTDLSAKATCLLYSGP